MRTDGPAKPLHLSRDALTLGEIDGLRDALEGSDDPLDLSGLARVDMAGAWFLTSLSRPLAGARPGVAALIDLAAEALPKTPPEPRPARRWKPPSMDGLIAGLGFFGRVLVLAAALPAHPGRLRLTSTFHHLRETGLSAIPIVTLMAFLIGVVLAFQGAAQLRQFGAQVFVVDLIAISVLRELGVLLTAIIVAGRSGAAFTAAIGSMKMREEVDALRTLGLDPVAVLALPRILALVVALPLLTVAADVAGLLGGATMSWIELGVSPGMFVTRMEAAIGASHYLVGLAKAPAFALIVGLTGCWFGLQVGSDAESLGRMTSRAVVVAIFLVIVADAAFSIFFAVLGV